MSADPPDGPRFHFRFDSGEGRLELAHPLRRGALTLEALTVSLGRLQGPVDLAPGAARFRHRRGRVLSARARLDPGTEGSEGTEREAAVIDGSDLLVPAGGDLAGWFGALEHPMVPEGDRVRIERPLHILLIEVLIPHGWRVPDERGTRVGARMDGAAVVLETEGTG